MVSNTTYLGLNFASYFYSEELIFSHCNSYLSAFSKVFSMWKHLLLARWKYSPISVNFH